MRDPCQKRNVLNCLGQKKSNVATKNADSTPARNARDIGKRGDDRKNIGQKY